ncbi:cellulose binding domain-containing protein [Micromonospora sp. NPDC048930]|uniref:cellulose binding domain-containing protein n=1 Tax=Micromonospora sp. NPDC048930 TaxID=3364261 RepID=UPI003723E8E1
MPAPPAQPRRTVAVILLDGIVAVTGAARRVVAGRLGGSRLVPAALAASFGLLAATAFAILMVPGTPERPGPVAVRPTTDVGVTGTPATGTPDERSGGSPPAPRASVRSATRIGPPAAAPPPVSASPGTTATPPSPPGLRAHFAVEENALFGYGAAVTISNPGSGAVRRDWALAVVLPRESLRVTSVSGARASQDGATWTFRPDGSSGTVPGRGSVRVTFRVSGAAINSLPTACTIDGTACTGLRD